MWKVVAEFEVDMKSLFDIIHDPSLPGAGGMQVNLIQKFSENHMDCYGVLKPGIFVSNRDFVFSRHDHYDEHLAICMCYSINRPDSPANKSFTRSQLKEGGIILENMGPAVGSSKSLSTIIKVTQLIQFDPRIPAIQSALFSTLESIKQELKSRKNANLCRPLA